uniref:DNA-directed RNA polymerase subunit beta n=1 Tax=Chromera velia TaxID=505693 RepID=D9IXE2_9ALVE|nr:RNA polymerase beta subunit [Chromera velia]ADJ66550.1 RNA polymerase beta subunit [Chromera velia]
MISLTALPKALDLSNSVATTFHQFNSEGLLRILEDLIPSAFYLDSCVIYCFPELCSFEISSANPSHLIEVWLPICCKLCTNRHTNTTIQYASKTTECYTKLHLLDVPTTSSTHTLTLNNLKRIAISQFMAKKSPYVKPGYLTETLWKEPETSSWSKNVRPKNSLTEWKTRKKKKSKIKAKYKLFKRKKNIKLKNLSLKRPKAFLQEKWLHTKTKIFTRNLVFQPTTDISYTHPTSKAFDCLMLTGISNLMFLTFQQHKIVTYLVKKQITRSALRLYLIGRNYVQVELDNMKVKPRLTLLVSWNGFRYQFQWPLFSHLYSGTTISIEAFWYLWNLPPNNRLTHSVQWQFKPQNRQIQYALTNWYALAWTNLWFKSSWSRQLTSSTIDSKPLWKCVLFYRSENWDKTQHSKGNAIYQIDGLSRFCIRYMNVLRHQLRPMRQRSVGWVPEMFSSQSIVPWVKKNPVQDTQGPSDKQELVAKLSRKLVPPIRLSAMDLDFLYYTLWDIARVKKDLDFTKHINYKGIFGFNGHLCRHIARQGKTWSRIFYQHVQTWNKLLQFGHLKRWPSEQRLVNVGIFSSDLWHWRLYQIQTRTLLSRSNKKRQLKQKIKITKPLVASPYPHFPHEASREVNWLQSLSFYNLVRKTRNKIHKLRPKLVSTKSLGLNHWSLFFWFRFLLITNTAMPNLLYNQLSFVTLLPTEWSVREFLIESPLLQYLDEINPLTEIVHKRRISALGLGGISANRERPETEERDVYPSYYGKLCAVETLEGERAGLVVSHTIFSRLTRNHNLSIAHFSLLHGRLEPTLKFLNFTEASTNAMPYYKIVKRRSKIFNGLRHLFGTGEYAFTKLHLHFRYLPMSHTVMFSPAAALTPFMFHNDPTRTLMAANMQRQATPLLYTQPSALSFGLESTWSVDTAYTAISLNEGIVMTSSPWQIEVRDIAYRDIQYLLKNLLQTNQSTVNQQVPCVWPGERIFPGQLLTSGYAQKNYELALGINTRVCYGVYYGYTFEDAILLNSTCIQKHMFTSLQLYEKKLLLGNLSHTSLMSLLLPQESLINVSSHGMLKPNSLIYPSQLLISKIEDTRPNFLTEKSWKTVPKHYHKIDSYIYDQQREFFENASIYALESDQGRLISLSHWQDGWLQEPQITFLVGHLMLMQLGDKVCGKHGNKGIVSALLDTPDMPYLEDGTSPDMIVSALGVPSRMNIGQLYECILGLTAEWLNSRLKYSQDDKLFCGEQYLRENIYNLMKQVALFTNNAWFYNPYNPGKILLREGASGQLIQGGVFYGMTYLFKLIHMVEKKIHTRPVGPYTLITQQPPRGRRQEGGQRLGEMEVWAIQAFSASYTLKELLVLKSDDLFYRQQIHDRLVSAEKLSFGYSETFKLLIRDLNILGVGVSFNLPHTSCQPLLDGDITKQIFDVFETSVS